jgi:homoserine acetyltransferase
VTTYFRPLHCIEGHDSFLIDIERFGREINRFLNDQSAANLSDL